MNAQNQKVLSYSDSTYRICTTTHSLVEGERDGNQGTEQSLFVSRARKRGRAVGGLTQLAPGSRLVVRFYELILPQFTLHDG